VLVVERGVEGGLRVGEHLAPSTLPRLERLGLLAPLLAGGHRRGAGVRSAWGEAELRDRDYLFAPEGEGFHLDRERFDAMVRDAAASAGATIARGTASAERAEGGFRVRTEGRRFHARVIADATGRAASFARAEGARRVAYDRLVGVAAVLEPRGAAPAEETLWIEAVEDGWWYSAPLPEGRLVATFFTDADVLARAGGSAALAAHALARSTHTGARLAAFSPPEAWHARPSCSEALDRAAGPGWLAVGDAATARDPLSSSGIAHALDDAADAAAALDAHLGGDVEALARYGAARLRGFDEYLETRTRYYRMERRFPKSPFWQRRRAGLDDAPISLDPRAVLRLAAHAQDRARRAAAALPSGVDVEPILRVAAAGAPAHALVAAHRRERPDAASDRAVILALQALLDRGVLERVEPGPAGSAPIGDPEPAGG
jgi:flavin-dependent dehydrogenase